VQLFNSTLALPGLAIPLNMALSQDPSALTDRNISVVAGAQDMELSSLTLGHLLEQQSKLYRNHQAVVFPWQGVRLTYAQLSDRSEVVARSLLATGLRPGDHVGIFAGNCYQYIEMFLGTGRIGCPLVVLNSTYTPQELQNAISVSRE
jgi:acyl-CoA synthetase (AMP-forming)/AMP-acid ligase II